MRLFPLSRKSKLDSLWPKKQPRAYTLSLVRGTMKSVLTRFKLQFVPTDQSGVPKAADRSSS